MSCFRVVSGRIVSFETSKVGIRVTVAFRIEIVMGIWLGIGIG